MGERVVLITGANGGLGMAVTEAFLRMRDKVIGASLHIESNALPNPNFRALGMGLFGGEQTWAPTSPSSRL
jgi:NAD(P)-dependent dehydrogenase (short-subunit alcohol dehydrogenase family)